MKTIRFAKKSITLFLFVLSIQIQAQTWNGSSTSTTTIGNSIIGGNLIVGANSFPTPQKSFEVKSALPGNFTKLYTLSSANSYLSVGNNNNANSINIGIGSATAAGYLWSSTGKVFIGTDGDPALFIDHTTKKIGIGTTDPDGEVTIVGTSNPYYIVRTPGSGPNVYTGLVMSVATCDGCWGSFVKNKDAVITTSFHSMGDLIIKTAGTGRSIRFGTSINNADTQKMRLTNSGALLIGTDCEPSDAKLAVNGKIYASALQIRVPNGSGCFPDYVFEPSYPLLSLPEVEKYIQANKHLPNIPSAKEVEEKGIDVADMDIKLLEKIEELTLHMIAFQKENEKIKKENQEIKAQLETLLQQNKIK